MPAKPTQKITTLWGSRFEEKPEEMAVSFAAGRDVVEVYPSDYKLLPYDIWVNRAHCVMLYKQKIITEKDANVILTGLSEIEQLVDEHSFVLEKNKEDVHANIESWLVDKYGIESAGKLHTARSRNDQVVTDVRLYVRDQIVYIAEKIHDLIGQLIDTGQTYKSTVMPGFTHHQHAMIETFGHMLLAFVTMLLRDMVKLESCYRIINQSPLGNTVGFGTSFPINRDLTAAYLGFDIPDLNSLDAITNRGEPEADLAYCLVSVMHHLSILAETLIILSMPACDMVTISDKYSTGSSIMPQKRNPDTLEVIKAKTAFAQGYLVSLLSIGKAAFIGYNRDSTWSKHAIMDLVDEVKDAPTIMKGVVKTARINKDQMELWAHKGFIGATSLLEMMCSTYDIPFRLGKIIVEKAIKYSMDKNKVDFEALKKSLQEQNIKIDITSEEVNKWQDPHEIIHLYRSAGSPGLISINEMIKKAKESLDESEKWLETKLKQKKQAIDLLDEEIKKLLVA